MKKINPPAKVSCFVPLLMVSFMLFPFGGSSTHAATSKAVIVNLSGANGGDPEKAAWINNGVERVAEAFLANENFETEILSGVSSENLKEKTQQLESSLSASTKGKSYDTVIVYLTGYVASQKPTDAIDIAFALSDYDAKRNSAAALPFTDISQILSNSSAKRKCLILDTFPVSADIKGSRIPRDSFRNKGAYSFLASNETGFQGTFWKEQEISLFAFWFSEAVRGSADRSLDGKITFKELDDYLAQNIANLSNAIGTPQKSQSLQLNRTGDPTDVLNNSVALFAPRPEGSAESVDRIADQIKAVIPHYGLNRIALPEFTLASGTKMSSARATLPNNPVLIPKDLEGRLASKLTNDRCVVYPQERLSDTLDTASIKAEEILSDKSQRVLGQIEVDGKPLSAMIVGVFKKSNSLSYTCGLIDITTMKPLLLSSSVIQEDVRNLKGDSVLVPDFPLEIQVKNKEGIYQKRNIITIEGKHYVPLEKGDIYQVVLWNTTTREVGFRVLVDGMNTHPERESTIIPGEELPKGFSTMKSRSGNYVGQKQIPLSEANFWILKPTPVKSDGSLPTGAQIKGFYSKIGENSVYREFTVAEKEASKAAGAGLKNEIGFITIGIYELLPKQRGSLDNGVNSSELGTKEGAERQGGEVKVFKGMETKSTLSLLHIRYITQEQLKAIR